MKKGILLHGGHGTRLRPLTHTGPKQLLPIANKPMSEYCVKSMIEAGITDLAVIIGGIGFNKVEEYYGNGEKFGIKISYIQQDFPHGIAHAIRMCKDFVDNEKFLVFLGDNIIQKSISNIVKEFESSNSDAVILLCEVSNPTQFGIADVKDGVIKKIMEKPKNPPTNLAVTGIYLLTPKIFDIIDRLKPSLRNEYEITDALQMLLDEGHKIDFDMITDYWKDTGTPQDIIHANNVILSDMTPYFDGIRERNVTIENNVMVGKGTIIKEGSRLVGPSIIGENCVIESNTYVGPNTSVGDNSKLSKCNIENSIIMSGCTIEGNLKIRNSIIAFNSEIIKTDNIDENIFLLGEGTKISL